MLCEGVPATPVWAWNPVPGATSYRVYVALDENFTFKALDDQTSFPPRTPPSHCSTTARTMSRRMEESAAGSAYYWYVVACGPTGCGVPPVSQDPPLPGAKTFKKQSPPIVGLEASNLNGTDITFSWQDYIVANTAPDLWREQIGTQSARTYRIQVDNDESFASPIDTATVDQTTYTATDQLYPEGTYFWRVQARDAEDNGLTWSVVGSFTKESPAVCRRRLRTASRWKGTVPFRWTPQAFASAYKVEIYKNNDYTFSSANRILSATVKTTAYTPSSPIQAAATPYLWRVRRVDTIGNPGPWSDATSFYSSGPPQACSRPQPASG